MDGEWLDTDEEDISMNMTTPAPASPVNQHPPRLTPEKIEQLVAQIQFTFAVEGIEVPRERALAAIERALAEDLPDL